MNHDPSRAEVLFLAAAEIANPRERAAFLEKECANDDALRRRVEALLISNDEAGDFLQPPAPNPEIEAELARLKPEEAGERIGNYKLLQQIGEGGFGVVWMAEQERPVRRRVALKIIKLGMDTGQVVARFEQERQALAMMDHPNIAKVLDAGATDTGRPYFVMELCKGDSITDYCDKHSLPIRERLALFVQVCLAVQHAHQKGLIHRDIKPSNILVRTQDDRAHAKVIDFGIAKATASKLTEKTLFTEHRQLIGTPEYMSPEQAEGSLDIDTRTDVYSLGVLLYELLTGSTPFDAKKLRSAAYGEIQRIIREEDPPNPSTRLSQSSSTLIGVAAARHSEPRKLGSIIRGELDWIVMKSLEKNRQRRYATAQGLAADVERYLGGEAIVAAPPGAAYRVRKFVNRHRGPVAAAGLVSTALIIGLAGTLWQASNVRKERDAAIAAKEAETQARQAAATLAASEARQRKLAENNEQKAEAINTFLLEMLGSADLREMGRDVKVSEALGKAADKAGTTLNDQPEVQASVRRILGSTFLSIGMPDAAEPQVLAAMELSGKLHGTESAEYARTLLDLSKLKLQRGDQAAAADAADRAAKIYAKILGPTNPKTLSARGQYANSLPLIGKAQESVDVLTEILDLTTKAGARESREGRIMVNSLAVSLHHLGKLNEAEALYREAVDISARLDGPEHPDTLTTRMNLASMLQARRKLAEAEPMMAESYALVRKVFGDSHTTTAIAATNLASLYDTTGKFKEAMSLYEESLNIRRRAEGEHTRGVALSKQQLAQSLSRLGEHPRAVAMEQESVAVYTAVCGAEDPQTLNARMVQANTFVAADRKAEAEAIFVDLLSVCPRVLGEDHRTTIVATNSYAVLLMRQDRYADAEPLVRKALEAGRRTSGPDSADTVITQSNLTGILRETGKLEEAEALHRDTIERFTRVFGPKHPNLATAHTSYAETLIVLRRLEDASNEYTLAIALNTAALGEKHASTADGKARVSFIMLERGDTAAAEPMLREAVELLTSARGEKHVKTANAGLELGRCLSLLGNFAEAQPLLSKNHALLVELRPAGHKDIAKAQRYLAALYTAWNAAEAGKGHDTSAAEWDAKVKLQPK